MCDCSGGVRLDIYRQHLPLRPSFLNSALSTLCLPVHEDEDVVDRSVLLLPGVVERPVPLPVLLGVVVHPQAQEEEERMFRQRTLRPLAYGGSLQGLRAERSLLRLTIMLSTLRPASSTITMVCFLLFTTSLRSRGVIHNSVVISSETLPVRMNFEIIRRLQEVIAPAIFTPRGAYDGRKNMFTPQELNLGETKSATVS